jgi:uncharacterized damage-inducible protein DinB
MKSFFKDLIEYNHDSNKEVIKLISANKECFSEKLHTLLSHTLNAQHIWNSRVQEKKPEFGVWQLHSIKDALLIDQDNFEITAAILEIKDMEHGINYTNSQAIVF